MYISELNVKGFRSLKDVSWKPGKLNVLIGPNGGGKTNVLKVLELLSASARGQLAKFVQREGGLLSIGWDGATSSLLFIASGSCDGYLRETYNLHLMKSRNVGNLIIMGEGVSFFDEEPIGSIERNDDSFFYYDRENREIMSPISLGAEETLLSAVAMPVGAPRTVLIQRLFAAAKIYKQFDTNSNAALRGAVVTRHDSIVEPDGQNLVEVLHTHYTNSRNFKASLDSALRAAFNDEFEELVFRPASDQRIQLGIRWKNLSRVRSAADLSDGTLRFLYLMAILANPEPPPLIAIDEPEAGLHPSMLPIIAEYAAAASEKTQVIFSTHSVSMLDAFRDVIPTTTVVECHDGATTLHTLDGEELNHWLKEYTLGDLFRSGELENMAHDTEASE